ncbi:MAG: nucleotide exchange factor GrpE [Clostridium sp.]|jgi:molecular chaperone GrpE|uniref:nucleotide exchange factor GrpE n=1 Tax=Clostridium sp. TaxID=1506 RepID=UPI0025BF9096|nr:nucleotide exchange factor GrpE [Clostridium sp.]MCH3964694.1 nucleotide exchange factor GrpE [Clostridium sp.]MCI1715165.1 nucleotide exchange factor GrpE [Clostridium sp.]MCI1799427.1 nucleotide exchange factor GrpE [Clostridium sp.]MCI1813348.1 nucleotide exchange factor GrpE [Clostridium sp.]MCI1870239.1 nucleotide exchange factor GrpE [Clostridium sp.]
MFKKKEDIKANNIEEDEKLEKDSDKDTDKSEVDEKAEVSEEYEEYNEKQGDEDSCEKESESDNVQSMKDQKVIKALKDENKNLNEENSRIKNELATLKDRLARTVAEYDNFRKRTAKEKEQIYTDVCEDVLKEVLPVLDNLERAVSIDGSADDLKKGVEMTMKQFNDALKKLDVEEIPVDGGFDPHLHNAVMHVEDESYAKNSVVEVFQKGYKKGDKVIRYSMVKVAN